MCREIPWNGEIRYYPSDLWIIFEQACASDLIYVEVANFAEVRIEGSWSA
jgi:hypothetical protein